MTAPVAAAHATQATPAFIHMISLFLSSPNQAATPQDTAASDAATALATPAQIADAMIKSMLGGPTPGNATLGTATAAPANQETAPATAADLATATAPDNKMTPSAVALDQTPASNKMLRDTSGIPQVTSVITAVPLAPAPVISLPTSRTPPAGDSRTNAALQNNPAPGPITPFAKGSLEAKIAFTAILTPTNETAASDTSASSASTESSQKVLSSAEPAASVPSTAPLASAAPSGNEAQSPATQAVQSESAVQAAGAKAGGDTPSGQQDNSSENPTPSTAIAADCKNKPALKQEDNDPQAIVAAAVPDHVSAVASFTDQAHTAVATQSTAPPPTATPSQSTAEALRTSESNLAVAPPSRTGVAQEITIRIEQPDASPVDLRVVERAGQVHIDVRTPDAAMQTSLRGDLGTLTNSLQRAGYQTEMFTPSSTLGRTASSAETSNRDDHQDSSQNRGGSGDSSEGRRQQQQQKRSSTRLEELEDQ